MWVVMELTTPPVRALLALSLLVSLSCASGVGDTGLDGVDSAASVADPEDDGDQDAGADASNEGWVAEPMLPESGPSAPRDSGTATDASARDAGRSDGGSANASDAGLDAGASGSSDAGLDAGNAPRDAGGANDAGADAGRDSGAQRDSGQSGGGTPGGGTPGGAGSCNPLNCDGCSVAGPFPCCRDNNTCGCTWAPGGYCL